MESLLSWPTEDGAEYTRTDIVRWWEARRLHFNAYVGVVGIFGSAIYAGIANACYTLGWVADTVSSQRRPRIGLYKTGVVFSVLLTALPDVWAVVAWLMTLITGHKLN